MEKKNVLNTQSSFWARPDGSKHKRTARRLTHNDQEEVGANQGVNYETGS